ncbi:hypothetical protein C6497_12995 [Candidatus Poribacteria bacterium]|nr:MAG: hypothetical protein C6497_12995 [Candidatus Poribacteria bacterium]
MFKELDGRIFVGGVIFAVLIVGGIYVYTQWSYNRFADEIGAEPQSTSTNESIQETGKITSSDQVKATRSPKSDNENLKGKQKYTVETESTHITEDTAASGEKTEASEFDASSLLSAFGIPEEVTSLLDENVEEADFEKAQAHFSEKYGESPEVEAIMDRLKQMSGGPVSLDALTDLFEAWVEVLPEDQQENRQQLMGILTVLNRVKDKGDSASAHIVVSTDSDLSGTGIDPSLLEGDNVQRFELKTVTTVTETDSKVDSVIIDD